MPGSVQELTDTLWTAIDAKGNVQDMSVVLNVVSSLEKIAVTVEDLKVTRLAKIVNLIRRKIADVDKHLSKRLKNLVKQWQQLLKAYVPNGVVPPGSTSTQEKPIPSPFPVPANVDGHASPLCVQATPSPSEPPSESIPHFKATNSLLASSDINNSQGSQPDSRGVHSRTPTPSPAPSSTHLACPIQPVSSNPANKRIKLMQIFSSVKRSPNKSPVRTEEPLHHLSSGSDFLSMHSDTSTIATTQYHTTARPTAPLTFQSSQPPIGSDRGSISRARNASEDDTRSLWTQGSFTDMMVEDFTNGSDWAPVSPKNSTDTSVLNGGPPDVSSLQINSKKRARSYSPLNVEPVHESLSTQPPHKKHKSKHGLHRPSECVVRIPLDRVRVSLPGRRGLIDVSKELNSDHKGLAAVVVDQHRNHKGMSEENKGLSSERKELTDSGLVDRQRRVHRELKDGHVLLTNSRKDERKELTDGHMHIGPTKHRGLMDKHRDHRGKKHCRSGPHFGASGLVDTLIVSFQRSLLNRVPVLNGKCETPLPYQQQSYDNTHQSHDRMRPSHDTTSSHDQWRQSHNEISETHRNGIVGTEPPNDGEAQIHNHISFIPPRQQRPCPPGACPGVDGCVGSDGYWYEWTEPINSCCAGEVPIMPYVYFDNFD